MARSFAGQASGGDYIDCGANASLNNLDPITILAWLYPTGNGGGGVGTVCGKVNAGFTAGILVYTNTGPLTANRYTDATGAAMQASTNLTLNAWTFAAIRYHIAGAKSNMYTGTPTALLSEVGYTTHETVSGALQSDAAENFFLGNHRSTATRTWAGLLGYGYVFNALLTLAEMQSVQFGIIPAHLWSDLKGFWPLWAPSSPEPDLSGNNNLGIVTQAIWAAGPPVGKYVQRARRFLQEGFQAGVRTSVAFRAVHVTPPAVL